MEKKEELYKKIQYKLLDYQKELMKEKYEKHKEEIEKNKDQENQGTQPSDIPVPQKESWNDINPLLNEQLTQKWKDKGFSKNQTRDWINIGLTADDTDFCVWLRDVKKVSAEWVLNHGDLRDLRREFAGQVIGEEVKPLKPKQTLKFTLIKTVEADWEVSEYNLASKDGCLFLLESRGEPTYLFLEFNSLYDKIRLNEFAGRRVEVVTGEMEMGELEGLGFNVWVVRGDYEAKRV